MEKQNQWFNAYDYWLTHQDNKLQNNQVYHQCPKPYKSYYRYSSKIPQLFELNYG